MLGTLPYVWSLSPCIFERYSYSAASSRTVLEEVSSTPRSDVSSLFSFVADSCQRDPSPRGLPGIVGKEPAGLGSVRSTEPRLQVRSHRSFVIDRVRLTRTNRPRATHSGVDCSQWEALRPHPRRSLFSERFQPSTFTLALDAFRLYEILRHRRSSKRTREIFCLFG